ncbi:MULTISPECIES: serine hydrolase [unclassified Facklamia]|uniref:serine hydrolase n=1 Tax=Aerococcaceae TaxID=186827 RepID=UPI0013BB4D08|nr:MULTISPECIES: serine hydrolase [unclassified Facklamia]NEW63984.1 serine hydrolase [Facklamia sp. 252]NEW67455.1 serine hydrolase [Facklamia sp. 253]QQD65329.1 serine hydrolase [Aerococcaceae bacterium zg-252]
MFRIILVQLLLLGAPYSIDAIDYYQMNAPVSMLSIVRSKASALFKMNFANIKGKHQLYFRKVSENTAPIVYNNQPARSASIIKLYILAVLFEQSEKGMIDLNSMYSLQAADIVGGTGSIQNAPIGTIYSLQQLAKEMIISSDNTATNILINELGGVQFVNQQIHQMGFKQTQLRRKMLDFKALENGIDNETTVIDVGNLLTRLAQGELVSKSASQSMLDILEQQHDHEKLFARMSKDIKVYNKTGTFAERGVLADAGIMEYRNHRYVFVVLSNNGEMTQQQQAMQKLGYEVGQLIVGDN